MFETDHFESVIHYEPEEMPIVERDEVTQSKMDKIRNDDLVKREEPVEKDKKKNPFDRGITKDEENLDSQLTSVMDSQPAEQPSVVETQRSKASKQSMPGKKSPNVNSRNLLRWQFGTAGLPRIDYAGNLDLYNKMAPSFRVTITAPDDDGNVTVRQGEGERKQRGSPILGKETEETRRGS